MVPSPGEGRDHHVGVETPEQGRAPCAGRRGGTSRPPTPSTSSRSQPAAAASIDRAQSLDVELPTLRGRRGERERGQCARWRAPPRTPRCPSPLQQDRILGVGSRRDARRHRLDRPAVHTAPPHARRARRRAPFLPTAGSGSGDRHDPARHEESSVGQGGRCEPSISASVWAGAGHQPQPARARLHGRRTQPLDQVAALQSARSSSIVRTGSPTRTRRWGRRVGPWHCQLADPQHGAAGARSWSRSTSSGSAISTPNAALCGPRWWGWGGAVEKIQRPGRAGEAAAGPFSAPQMAAPAAPRAFGEGDHPDYMVALHPQFGRRARALPGRPSQRVASSTTSQASWRRASRSRAIRSARPRPSRRWSR